MVLFCYIYMYKYLFAESEHSVWLYFSHHYFKEFPCILAPRITKNIIVTLHYILLYVCGQVPLCQELMNHMSYRHKINDLKNIKRGLIGPVR